MTDNINHPNHYVKNGITLEPIELTGRLNSCIGQAVQYVIRRKDKGSELEDLQKARFWLNWYKENIAKSSVYEDDDDLFVNDKECEVYVEKVIETFAIFTKDEFTRLIITTLFYELKTTVTITSLDETLELLDNEIERLKAQEGQGKAEDHLKDIGEDSRTEQ